LVEQNMAGIIDRGRGPEIAGTRITVYDVLEYWQDDWHPTAIAALFNLTSDQVRAATRYIEEHKEEVLTKQRKIRERMDRGNPPEVEAKRQASRAKLQSMLAQCSQSSTAGDRDAGPAGR
jgi:uncharacterized protein (DUF433 family)